MLQRVEDTVGVVRQSHDLETGKGNVVQGNPQLDLSLRATRPYEKGRHEKTRRREPAGLSRGVHPLCVKQAEVLVDDSSAEVVQRRIDRLAVLPDLVVYVVIGGPSRVTDLGDDLSPFDILPGANEDFGAVGVPRLEAVAVISRCGLISVTNSSRGSPCGPTRTIAISTTRS